LSILVEEVETSAEADQYKLYDVAPLTNVQLKPRAVVYLIGDDKVGAAGGVTTWMAKIPDVDQFPAASRSWT
jgi:hypothetical protein